MASFIVDLWQSIFTPGPTPSLLKAANLTFAALQLVLLLLLCANASIHAAILSVLSAGLWWSVNWFAAELALAQQQQQRQQQQQQELRRRGHDDTPVLGHHLADVPTEDSSDTEVESPAQPTGAAVEIMGRLRQRGATNFPTETGTQSSMSTEDEWEKVPGSERDKQL